jgi:hypothetical protein
MPASSFTHACATVAATAAVWVSDGPSDHGPRIRTHAYEHDYLVTADGEDGVTGLLIGKRPANSLWTTADGWAGWKYGDGETAYHVAQKYGLMHKRSPNGCQRDGDQCTEHGGLFASPHHKATCDVAKQFKQKELDAKPQFAEQVPDLTVMGPAGTWDVRRVDGWYACNGPLPGGRTPTGPNLGRSPGPKRPKTPDWLEHVHMFVQRAEDAARHPWWYGPDDLHPYPTGLDALKDGYGV